MSTQKKGRIAFAVCGSFCTLETALEAARMLTLTTSWAARSR